MGLTSNDENSERPIRPTFEADEARPPADRATLLDYLRLFRAPNVFTAMADVAMGFLITTKSLSQWPSLALLLVASSLIYTAGMVLNDVFDIEVDRRERPLRPLPSGKIAWGWARWLGFQFLFVGVVAGCAAGFVSMRQPTAMWRSGIVASILAAAVVLYDCWAKRTLLGPLVMGSCRFLNVLLGMSLYAVAVAPETRFAGFGTSHLMIAAGIGLYIVGVTLFAKGEAATSRRSALLLGVLVMAGGIATLALFPRLHPESFAYRYEPNRSWPLGLAVLSFWILRRAVLAVRDPNPHYVQGAVKVCILSLIVLDALVCSLICPWPYAVGVVALLLPTVVLGRSVYST